MESQISTVQDLCAVLESGAATLRAAVKGLATDPEPEWSEPRARQVLLGLAFLRADLERVLQQAEKLAGVEHLEIVQVVEPEQGPEAANSDHPHDPE
jgi:hypothetical protein